MSDVYASPYFQASPDSLHGYDITDHNKLNPAIGSRADYDAWIAQLHAHGMGHVLDFVPNHVGIADSTERVVDGRAGKRAQLKVCAIFRYRLGTAEISICATRSCCQFSATNTDACWNVANCRCALRKERFTCSMASADCRSRPALIATFWKSR